jgi:FAD:protein FMN transferase
MLEFEAIGTHWSIETSEPLAADAVAAIADCIESYDAAWSRFRHDSLVSRIATAPGTWQLPGEADALLEVYRVLYEATDGRVSPLVGRALEKLGYDAAYSLRDTGTHAPVIPWADALEWNGRVLTTYSPVLLDVGAAGKGHLVDLVAQVLREHGVHEYVVDASGDLVHAGSRPTRVALEHPLDEAKAIGVVELANGALCASASNRRAWGAGLHHVIDASTGLPTSRVIATWVIAPNALVADGLATGLFFADAARFDALAPFQWARMLSTGRVEHSDDFEGELFL